MCEFSDATLGECPDAQDFVLSGSDNGLAVAEGLEDGLMFMLIGDAVGCIPAQGFAPFDIPDGPFSAHSATWVCMHEVACTHNEDHPGLGQCVVG
jgi:hypothetical protein